MKNETEYGMQLLELSEAGMASAEQICRAGTCALDATITLEDQAFCLNHFLLRCYERLEELEPRSRGYVLDDEKASMRAFVEECSLKALQVSLNSENPTNLQRGRLLDILLWSAELFLSLRVPQLSLAQSTGFSVGQSQCRIQKE